MFDNNTIVFNENKHIEDKRRYAYEKAIEAYWKHVDRYHTWMNYYAIFNGALFVGFCTLLTATTEIRIITSTNFTLLNNYSILNLMLCILGFISSVSWLLSIKGHEKWERNWMNIIEEYEHKKVYRLIMAKRDDIVDKQFKAYSTHKITKLFVFTIILSWIISPILLPFINCGEIEFCIIVILIAVYFLCLVGFYCVECKSLYSDIRDKEIKFK